MPEEQRVFTPNRTYDIQVKIKNLDYTNDTISVNLASSLSTAYQVVTLTLSLDPNDIILDDLFGGAPIKLSITLHREQVYPGPRIDIDLMYVSSEFQLTEKDEYSQQTQKDRTFLTVVTVAREAYIAMSSLVNRVFIGTNLSTIVSRLGSDVGVNVNYDTDGQNTTAIDQVCIPPTTFYKIIKEYSRNNTDMFDGYLDQRFGLFDGVPGVFCQFDKTVNIMNLTRRLQKAQTFTIYELAGMRNRKETDRIMEECLDGKTFYTYDTIHTDYSGNAKFASLATDIRNIVCPDNTLTATIPQDLATVARENSVLYQSRSKSSNLFIDPAVNRTKYYNQDTGYNLNRELFNSRIGRLISDMSSISINIERNLPVLSLMQVGECVKFKPKTVEYTDFEGKYILWSSEINFLRPSDWETTATINLVRTNKKS